MTNELSQPYTETAKVAAPLIEITPADTIAPAPKLEAQNDNQILSPESALVRRRRRTRSRLAR